MSRIGQYWKFIVAAAGAAATILVTLGVHSTAATIIVSAATALGVYAAPNKAAAVPAGSAAAPSNVTVVPPQPPSAPRGPRM